MEVLTKVLVAIPTYNEALSISGLIQNLLNSPWDLEILVIDDNSPDGTGAIVNNLGSPRVHLIGSARKSGLGSAYLKAFTWALLNGNFTHLATMDGDGSHRPNDLELMLESAQKVEVLLGTRWMPGGGIENWPKVRQRISKMGTSYARWALKYPFRDLTGGFRVYSIETLGKIDLEKIQSQGYCFQIEMVRAARSVGATFAEMPITFVERATGKSKMGKGIVMEAFLRVSLWGLNARLNPNADKLHYVK